MNNIVELNRISISNIRRQKKLNSLEKFNQNNPGMTPSKWGSYSDEREYLTMAYHLLLKRGFDNVKQILMVLLKNFKHCNENDIQKLLSSQDSNVSHLFNYISNLQMKVAQQRLPEKINKIYLETPNKTTDISPKVYRLFQTEGEIKLLNNKLMSKMNKIINV